MNYHSEGQTSDFRSVSLANVIKRNWTFMQFQSWPSLVKRLSLNVEVTKRENFDLEKFSVEICCWTTNNIFFY